MIKKNYILFYLFQCRYTRGVPPFNGGTYIFVLTNRLMVWNLDNPLDVVLGIACTVDLLWGYPYLVKLFQDGVLCPSHVLSLNKRRYAGVTVAAEVGVIGLGQSGDVSLLRGCIGVNLYSPRRSLELR